MRDDVLVGAGAIQRVAEHDHIGAFNRRAAASDRSLDGAGAEADDLVANIDDGADVLAHGEVAGDGNLAAVGGHEIVWRDDADQGRRDVLAQERDGDAVCVEGGAVRDVVDVAVGDAGGLALAAPGDEVAQVAGRCQQRLAEAVARKERLCQAGTADELCEERFDGVYGVDVANGGLHADEVIARGQDVVRCDLHRQVGVVERGRRGEAELGDLRAGVNHVQQVVDAGGPDHGRLSVGAIVDHGDGGVVGGVLQVEAERPLFEGIALRIAWRADEVGVEDLPAERADDHEAALRLLDDDLDLAVGEQVVAQPAAAHGAFDQVLGGGNDFRDGVRRGAGCGWLCVR